MLSSSTFNTKEVSMPLIAHDQAPWLPLDALCTLWGAVGRQATTSQVLTAVGQAFRALSAETEALRETTMPQTSHLLFHQQPWAQAMSSTNVVATRLQEALAAWDEARIVLEDAQAFQEAAAHQVPSVFQVCGENLSLADLLLGVLAQRLRVLALLTQTLQGQHAQVRDCLRSSCQKDPGV